MGAVGGYVIGMALFTAFLHYLSDSQVIFTLNNIS
jgi:hypothetical protein